MQRLPSFRRSGLFFLLLLGLFWIAVAPYFEREKMTLIPAFAPTADGVAYAQLDEMGRQIARAVEKGDTEVLGRMFDEEGFFRRTMGGESLPETELGEFREGLVAGVRQKNGLVFENVLGEEIEYIGVRRIGTDDCPLLRILESGGAFDYIAVMPAQVDEGHLEIADFYSFRSGEWLSSILNRASEYSIDAMKRTRFEMALAREDDRNQLEEMKHFEEAGSLLREGKVDAALMTFEFLSTLKDDRSAKVLFLRILDALPGQADVLEAALAQLAKEEPEGTTAPVMGLNLAIRTGSLKGKDHLVHQLKEIVGPDPFLEAWRAQVAMADGDPAMAFRLAGEVIVRDPDVEQGWWALVGSGLKLRKYQSVAEGLGKLDREFSHHFHSDDFKSLQAYRPFLRSEPGLEFIRSLP